MHGLRSSATGATIAAKARAVFGLSQRETCYRLRAILVVGGQPETQVTTYFPPEIGSRLNRADFDDVLIFRSVQRHLGLRLAAAADHVKAEVAGPDVARDLDGARKERRS